jgi:hypothetical protein
MLLKWRNKTKQKPHCRNTVSDGTSEHSIRPNIGTQYPTEHRNTVSDRTSEHSIRPNIGTQYPTKQSSKQSQHNTSSKHIHHHSLSWLGNRHFNKKCLVTVSKRIDLKALRPVGFHNNIHWISGFLFCRTWS